MKKIYRVINEQVTLSELHYEAKSKLAYFLIILGLVSTFFYFSFQDKYELRYTAKAFLPSNTPHQLFISEFPNNCSKLLKRSSRCYLSKSKNNPKIYNLNIMWPKHLGSRRINSGTMEKLKESVKLTLMNLKTEMLNHYTAILTDTFYIRKLHDVELKNIPLNKFLKVTSPEQYFRDITKSLPNSFFTSTLVPTQTTPKGKIFYSKSAINIFAISISIYLFFILLTLKLKKASQA